MRIVAISDTHGFHGDLKLPEGDILIHGGDFSKRGGVAECRVFSYWLRELANQFKHIIFIAGNHDFLFEKHPDQVKEYILRDNIHYLENSGIEIAGLKFWGSPYTPQFHDWAFMKNDMFLASIWNKIPLDTNVLITHGPMSTVLDKTRGGERVGSMSLYQKIKELRTLSNSLKVHICGHIHEGYGEYELDTDFMCYNVSVLNEYYQLTNLPTIIDL